MLQPVARQTLGQQVLRSLGRYIVAHKLGPGNRLPPERVLAAELGVSCNTLREALKVLEVIGALSRQPKRGSVLQPIDFALLAEVAQFQLLRSPADLANLFIARRLLEVSVLPLVVRNATEDDFQRMDTAIRLMEAAIDAGGIGVEEDLQFHRALLAATRNKFLTQFGALLQEFFRQARTRLLADEQEAWRSLEDHRQILGALRSGEVERAQRLMEEHLDHYVRRGLVQAPPEQKPGKVATPG